MTLLILLSYFNNIYSEKVNKTENFKERQTKNNTYMNSKNKEKIKKPQSSIISRNIHGKYSRNMICEKWKAESSSEDDFTIVSLHIPSNKQVSVHLKFYPAKPINKSIMIDYNFKFERYEFSILKLNISLEPIKFYQISNNTFKKKLIFFLKIRSAFW